MIADANYTKSQKNTLELLANLIADQLHELEIRGNCSLYWNNGWLRLTYSPMGLEANVVTCVIPCKRGDRVQYGMFIDMVELYSQSVDLEELGYDSP